MKYKCVFHSSIIVILQKFNRAHRYLDSVSLCSHPSACHVVTMDNFLRFRAKFHLQTLCMSNELESNKYFSSINTKTTVVFNTFGMSQRQIVCYFFVVLSRNLPGGVKMLPGLYCLLESVDGLC